MNILLFGKPGSGKGTQAPRIAESLGVPTLATGDVLRNAAREGTPLGKKAKTFMDKGDLVPDDVILGVVGETLAKPEYEKGVIMDGVVRTVPQAEGLDKLFKSMKRKLDAVLAFDLEDEEIVRRLSGRTICEKCQSPYSGRNAGEKCEKCGGTLVRRKDDEPDAIRNRLAVYRTQTAPVFDWYQKHGPRVTTVSAVGGMEDIAKRALKALGR